MQSQARGDNLKSRRYFEWTFLIQIERRPTIRHCNCISFSGAESAIFYRMDSLALRAKLKSKTRSGGTGCAALTR
jgi:hypothetical protein